MQAVILLFMLIAMLSGCVATTEHQPNTSATSQNSATKPPAMKCLTGPVSRTFGGSPWAVYSCEDNRSFVVVATNGNPAMPFYFIFAAREQGYQLFGEGTGRKEATAAAFEELKSMSAHDIAVLLDQTRNVAKTRPSQK